MVFIYIVANRIQEHLMPMPAIYLHSPGPTVRMEVMPTVFPYQLTIILFLVTEVAVPVNANIFSQQTALIPLKRVWTAVATFGQISEI